MRRNIFNYLGKKVLCWLESFYFESLDQVDTSFLSLKQVM